MSDNQLAFFNLGGKMLWISYIYCQNVDIAAVMLVILER